MQGVGSARRAGDAGDRGVGRARGFEVEREELIAMGWWRTRSGSVIGDSPADIIEEFDERCWPEPMSIPPDVRARITACYREDFDREPTTQELRELLEFCGPGPETD